MSLAEPTLLNQLKDAAGIVQALVTASGIIVGALFTYYKFIKDRVYRPRLRIGLATGRIVIDNLHYLIVRVSVMNLGSTKLSLNQAGTALIVSQHLAASSDFHLDHWREQAVLAVLTKHQWLEVAEQISDEVSIRVPPREDDAYRIDARLVVQAPHGNVEIWSRLITHASKKWTEPDQAL